MRTLLSLFAVLPLLRAEPPRFGRDVMPILSDKCFTCHGPDEKKRKADLRLDTEAGAMSMIVRGKHAESELIKRVLSKEPGELMPPAKSNKTLTAKEIEILKQWIDGGAKWGTHWAFEKFDQPTPPGRGHPIDAFIQAKLKKEGLTPSPEASKETLIRRVTLDLTGLPPTLQEIDDFLKDDKPGAYERVVDRSLASPRYGERMALPWLDAARYADSNGFQQDGDTFQWVWRDWVVKALNDNMPFDKFTIEQLAGDLLPNATQEQKIATGFNRNHMLNGEGGAIKEEQRFVILFDRVDTTATTWLALTMACAQCHDHKYDPITQKDYYSLMAGFNNLPEDGGVQTITSKIRVAPPFLDITTPETKKKLADLEAKLAKIRKEAKADAKELEWEVKTAKDDNFPEKRVLEYLRIPKAKRNKGEVNYISRYFKDNVQAKLLPEVTAAEKEIARVKGEETPKVMVMSDDKPRVTHILDRGNYEAPKEKVSFAFPEFLSKQPAKNRLDLANWLVSPDHPLTSRVAVNRYWQQFFGTGLVKTSEDFGVQSEAPLHAELLDWLAGEFRKTWDVKAMHRLIVTSATYKQSSHVTQAMHEKDPENKLLARAPRLRLPSLLLRDQALFASGLLVEKLGGKPVYPYQPKEIWDSLAITKERDFTYPLSKGDDLYRRSLYTFWRRTVAPSNAFDASARNVCKVRSATTNTPLHALTVLNDPTYVEAARFLAEKALKEKEPLAFAFRSVLGRRPDAEELKLLEASLQKQRKRFADDRTAALAFLKTGAKPRDEKLDAAEHAAFAAVCLGMLNLDEALTRE